MSDVDPTPAAWAERHAAAHAGTDAPKAKKKAAPKKPVEPEPVTEPQEQS